MAEQRLHRAQIGAVLQQGLGFFFFPTVYSYYQGKTAGFPGFNAGTSIFENSGFPG